MWLMDKLRVFWTHACACVQVYSSTLDAMTQIVRKEGALALYRGLTPTLLQIAPQTGFQFGFYSGFSLLWDVWGKQSTTQSTPAEQSTGVGENLLKLLIVIQLYGILCVSDLLGSLFWSHLVTLCSYYLSSANDSLLICYSLCVTDL